MGGIEWLEGHALVISARFLREGCEISQALRQESRSTPTKGVLLMQNEVPSIQSSRYPNRPKPDGATRIALDENELAIRAAERAHGIAAAGDNT